MRMNPLAYSVVIATVGRAEELELTLRSLARQSHQPERVVVVDSSGAKSVKDCVEKEAHLSGLPAVYQPAVVPGAASQRNEGAEDVSTPLIAFIDDDMELLPDTAEQICAAFEHDKEARIGGVAARMKGASHPPPKGPLWLYYRLQAGFSHETYGARLFGPAINCFPCFARSDEELIRADWLNSACVFFRTPVFKKERFPDFPGSSYMEDVHLSARIAKTHTLYFHGNALCIHRDGAKAMPPLDLRKCAAMRIANQRKVARELLGARFLELKLFLHKLFVCLAILRFQPEGKWQSILGTLLA